MLSFVSFNINAQTTFIALKLSSFHCLSRIRETRKKSFIYVKYDFILLKLFTWFYFAVDCRFQSWNVLSFFLKDCELSKIIFSIFFSNMTENAWSNKLSVCVWMLKSCLVAFLLRFFSAYSLKFNIWQSFERRLMKLYFGASCINRLINSCFSIFKINFRV